MLFNSFEFLLFFPTVFVLYFLTPDRHRWLLLLVASYFFYMSWEPRYVVLILASTTIDYFCGLEIGNSENAFRKKLFLTVSVLGNLTILFTFKYLGFFAGILEGISSYALAPTDLPRLEFLLPVGISFYTFQSMSYTIDVFRGQKEPEPSFGKFALYVSFFPQLVAGPVERSTRLLPQFDKSVSFDYQRIADGLKLAAWGMFQKVVIADRLALLVDDVYSDPEYFGSSMVVLATYFIPLQVLCDFQGYTNIAQGTARTLGFELMENFKQPFFARSTPEFWAKYHISVTTWFRDYVYFPLGGNRLSLIPWIGNVMFLFVIIGFWHGANWTWVLFGVFHAIIYLVYRYIQSLDITVRGLLRPVVNTLAVVFCFHLLAISSIAYRAQSLSSVWLIVEKLPAGFWELLTGFYRLGYWNSLPWSGTEMTMVNFTLSILLIGFFMTTEWIEMTRGLWEWLQNRSTIARWAFYYGLIFGIFFLGIWKEYEFIYFQF